MLLIGLTGGIATGKSTVASILANEYHIPIIDADLIAREIVRPGQPAWKQIVKEFGADILLPNQELDRGKLGAIIFADSARRQTLNRITHPVIHKIMFTRALKYFLTGHRLIIFDIPLLYETNSPLLRWLAGVIVVTCEPESLQLARLLARNPEITPEEARQRIASQWPLAKKCSLARWVIDNSKQYDSADQRKEALRAQIGAIINECDSHWSHWIPARALLLSALGLVGYYSLACAFSWIY